MGSNSSCEDNSSSRYRAKSKISNWFTLPSLDRSTTSPTGSPSQNVFQRMKKNIEKHLPGYRPKCGCSTAECSSEEMSASGPVVSMMDNEIDEDDRGEGVAMECDEKRKALRKKWLDIEIPNMIMYRACIEMMSYAWYWGEISRHEAQRQLTDKPNGCFLIRNSEKGGAQFTLSFRMWNRTLHYRIQYYDNYWHFEARKYESMVEMVENFMNRSSSEIFFVQQSGIMPPFPVVLRSPLSRYVKFVTLQELCRRVIRTNVSKQNIDTLPIPVQLKEFLVENRSENGIQ